MNHHLEDPALQALEARLAGVVPRVSTIERNELLYQCAFAAGRQAANRAMRGWQATAAILTVLLLGLSIPVAQNGLLVAKREPAVPHPLPSPPPTVIVDRDAEIVRSPIANVSTDAWQITKSSSELELAQADTSGNPLALASLTRSVLEQ